MAVIRPLCPWYANASPDDTTAQRGCRTTRSLTTTPKTRIEVTATSGAFEVPFVSVKYAQQVPVEAATAHSLLSHYRRFFRSYNP